MGFYDMWGLSCRFWVVLSFEVWVCGLCGVSLVGLLCSGDFGILSVGVGR